MNKYEGTWYLASEPYNVQLEASRRAWRLYGYNFFMEMGLGKTATVLNEFANYHAMGIVDTLVIICPNALMWNWVNEAIEQGFPFDIQIHRDYSNKKDACITIGIESVIHSAGEWVTKKFCKDRKVYLAVDESSSIKNPNSSRSKWVMNFANQCVVTRCLSGTHAPEGPQNVWTQMRVAKADVPNKFVIFRAKYCMMGGFKGKQVVGIIEGREQEYFDLVNERSFIARKKDWIDLPEKMYVRRGFQLGEDQLVAYVNLKSEMYTMLEDGEEVTTEQLVTQMLRLQQISSGFVKDDEGNIKEFKDNPKLDSFMELIKEVEGRIVVICMARHSIASLEARLERDGLSYAVVHGGIDIKQREVEKKRFNEGDARIFLVQSQTGKYGLTLLGTQSDPCKTMIFYENSFSLEARSQAEDRIHRIGQKNDCMYIDFVGSDIERYVIRALQRKDKVFKDLLDSRS